MCNPYHELVYQMVKEELEPENISRAPNPDDSSMEVS